MKDVQHYFKPEPLSDLQRVGIHIKWGVSQIATVVNSIETLYKRYIPIDSYKNVQSISDSYSSQIRQGNLKRNSDSCSS